MAAGKPKRNSRVKSIYFPIPGEERAEASADGGRKEYGKVVAIAFRLPDHEEEWEWIRVKGSDELREFFRINEWPELEAKAAGAGLSPGNYLRDILFTKFAKKREGKRLSQRDEQHLEQEGELRRAASTQWEAPFRGLAPNIEDSPDLIALTLAKYAPHATRLLDPFAGTGNIPLVAARSGYEAYYCEVDPLFRRIVNIKTDLVMRTPEGRRSAMAPLDTLGRDVLQYARRAEPTLDAAGRFRHARSPEVARLAAAARELVDARALREPLFARCAELIVAAALGRVDAAYESARKAGRPLDVAEMRQRFTDWIDEDVQRLRALLEDAPPLVRAPHFLCDDVTELGYYPSRDIQVVMTAPPPLLRHGSPPPRLEREFLGLPLQDPDFLREGEQALISELVAPRSGRVRLGELREREEAIRVLLHGEERGDGVTLRKMVERVADGVGQAVAIEVAAYFLFVARALGGLARHLAAEATVIVEISNSVVGKVTVDVPALLASFLDFYGFAQADEVKLGRRVSTRGTQKVEDRLLVFTRHPSPEC